MAALTYRIYTIDFAKPEAARADLFDALQTFSQRVGQPAGILACHPARYGAVDGALRQGDPAEPPDVAVAVLAHGGPLAGEVWLAVGEGSA